MDYTVLSNEINTDPLNLGYAQYITMGSDYGISLLLNSTAGNGTGTIALSTMNNADFVTAFLPYLANLDGLTAQKQGFYTLIWQTILAMPVINFSDGTVEGIMNQAVADGLLTQAQAISLNQRIGSRAEVLFGAGVIIDHLDIAQALR